MKNSPGLLLFLFLLLSWKAQTQANILEKISLSENDLLKPIFSEPMEYEVQILYTQIDRDSLEGVQFTEYTYRVDPESYFYPASTVKLPIAILALEKLQQLKAQFPSLTRETPYTLAGETLESSIAKDVKAIFAVSDNEAYNRLFEFLGQDYINERLTKKGLFPIRISHRLSTDNSHTVETKQLIFEGAAKEKSKISLPVSKNKETVPLQLKAIQKGMGYIENDTLRNEPFDFSLKNYFPLQVQHQVMKQLIFPLQFEQNMRFDLAEGDREFLLEAMALLPQEAGYDPSEYYDSYVKFFMYGDTKNPIPSQVKIYNKVGFAYGTLTETAYIKDESRNVEFFLSATLLVNKNGIFNDNSYQYETLGIPFLAALGREIYELEIKRKN